MGQACTTPVISSDDDTVTAIKACTMPVISSNDDTVTAIKLISREMKCSTAEEGLEFPGAEVVIIDADGKEATVTAGTFRFIKPASPSRLAILFVGESFEDLDARSFFYPLLGETPVCLSSSRATEGRQGSRILIVEGDVYGIRLPDPLAGDGESAGKLQALIDLLEEHCTFRQAEESGYKLAGHLLQRGEKLIDINDWATKKVLEEVHTSHRTQAAVSAAKFATGGTAALARSVSDGLTDTAMILGQETQNDMVGPQKDNEVVKLGRVAGVAGLQVLASLKEAGDRLADEAIHETAEVVGHLSGKDVGDVAQTGMCIAKDIAMYTARGLIEGQPVEHSSLKLLMSRAEAVDSNLLLEGL